MADNSNPILAGIQAALSPAAMKEFVIAVKTAIDNSVIKTTVKDPNNTTFKTTDYLHAGLDYSAPAGGWISPQELRNLHVKITEAIAREKWVEGFIVAIQLVAMFGGAA